MYNKRKRISNPPRYKRFHRKKAAELLSITIITQIRLLQKKKGT